MNKRDKNTVLHYLRSTNYNLFDCYKSASCYKWRAYNSIIEEMQKLGGYNFKIINYNKMMFTCGFTFENENGGKFLKYYTPTKTSILFLGD